MLHKPKSKNINLLKYGIVLPVLVLFLMSFNTQEVYIDKTQISANDNSNDTFFISNNFTDTDFNSLEKKLYDKNFSFELKELKRNSDNLITKIFIKISKNGVEGSYRMASPTPINTFVIKYYKNENKFIINSLNFIEAQKKAENAQHVIGIVLDKKYLSNKKSYVIKKQYTDASLNHLVTKLKKEGISIKFSNVKRTKPLWTRSP